MKKFLVRQDGEKFLFMPTKFRRWLISTLDTALNELRAELATYGIQKVIHNWIFDPFNFSFNSSNGFEIFEIL